MELFDYADSRVGTAVSCTSPSTTGYEVAGLLSKRPSTTTEYWPSPPLHLINNAAGSSTGGFMAESFVRPPVDVVFALPHQTSLAAVVVDPRIRHGRIRHATVFTMGANRTRWECVGRLVCEKETRCCYALHNSDVAPEMMRTARIHGSSCGVPAPSTAAAGPSHISWTCMRAPVPSALHYVSRIKLTIASMHDAHVPGLGGIAILGQPSQRLPAAQRITVWTELCQAVIAQQQQQQQQRAATDSDNRAAPPGCPPEFIDPITLDVMPDPVVLPSAVRCDRSTIARHLDGGHRTDPFTGLPMDRDQIQPDLALRLRIQAWLDKDSTNASNKQMINQCYNQHTMEK
ncbi:RING finger protein 37 [Coemansia sp. RSA 1200]|nr:RING finger protein 37 [Coemansia sp. RSA 1200]